MTESQARKAAILLAENINVPARWAHILRRAAFVANGEADISTLKACRSQLLQEQTYLGHDGIGVETMERSRLEYTIEVLMGVCENDAVRGLRRSYNYTISALTNWAQKEHLVDAQQREIKAKLRHQIGL